jgi:hypothetical protein
MSTFVGQARFNGCIAFTGWLRPEVEALLPPELQLVGDRTGDLHPILFMFGEQASGAMLFGGFTLPTGPPYQELAVVIPSVMHRAVPEAHIYVPRMYASYFPAVWSGNVYYGLGKAMARLGWEGSVFVVREGDGAPLLHVEVEAVGHWSPGCAGEPDGLPAMRAVLAHPVLGRTADGSYVSSRWGCDFSEAQVRPSDCRISIDAPLLPGLTPRRCRGAVPGAFEVRSMLWKVSWPSRPESAIPPPTPVQGHRVWPPGR